MELSTALASTVVAHSGRPSASEGSVCVHVHYVSHNNLHLLVGTAALASTVVALRGRPSASEGSLPACTLQYTVLPSPRLSLPIVADRAHRRVVFTVYIACASKVETTINNNYSVAVYHQNTCTLRRLPYRTTLLPNPILVPAPVVQCSSSSAASVSPALLRHGGDHNSSLRRVATESR